MRFGSGGDWGNVGYPCVWPPGPGKIAAGLQELREWCRQALREEPLGRTAARAKVVLLMIDY